MGVWTEGDVSVAADEVNEVWAESAVVMS